jgi:tripartite-type tricarboxylate transporter receptor subunit TctC
MLSVLPLFSVAQAEWKPQAPIKLIVPFGPGGTTDIVARAISDGMSKELGQTVVVENRPGAGGAIATRDMAKADADGLTLGLSTVSTFGSNHVFFDNPLYHPIDDFTHIITIAATPKIMIARPDPGLNSVSDVIQSAKNGKKLNYGSAGLSVDQLYGEIFKKRSGAPIQLVPYKSGAPAMNDFLGGHIQLMFDNLPLVIPHVRDGKARLLAVSWPTRLKEFPDVPTWQELGYQELSAATWYGLVGPKGIPPAAVKRLNEVLVKVLKDPAVIQRLENSGANVVSDTPEQSRQLASTTFQRLSKIGADAGIQKQTRQ